MGQALSAPVINDVSTNLEDPPVFTRSQHPAALSDTVKRACSKAYAKLQPLAVPNSNAAAVFAAARRAAAALPRASIVHEDAAAGVLELLDVTALMRFKDDVAVRWAAGEADRRGPRPERQGRCPLTRASMGEPQET